MPLTAEQFNEMDPAEKARIAKMLSGQSPSIPGLPDFQAPKNVWQGLGNIVKNQRQIIGERLGTRESPTDLARRYQITSTVQAENRRRQLADLLINQGAPAAVRNMSADALEKLYAGRVGEPTPLHGGVAQKNLLTGAQNMLVQPPTVPTAVSEYEYMLQNRADRRSAFEADIAESTPAKQAELRKQLEAFGADPSYMQWRRSTQAKSGGTSRYRWEQLLEINPDIKKMDPEDQQALFLSTIRESPEESGRAAKLEEMARNGGLFLTPGAKKRDELFAATSIEYLTNGGRISSRRNMFDLDKIIRQLKGNPKLTGIVEAAKPDPLRNPQSLAIQGDIERIIVMDLRATLGAQFTENESKQFVARSFNMLLPGDVNANRLQRMRAAITQSQELYMDAIKYFQSNNSSLQGFEGKIFDQEDFEKAVFKAEDYDSVSDDKLHEMIKAGLKERSIISDAEFEAMRLQLLKREQRK
jgi:hypothetical protein